VVAGALIYRGETAEWEQLIPSVMMLKAGKGFVYNTWNNPTKDIPLLQTFYFFNITNPVEVMTMGMWSSPPPPPSPRSFSYISLSLSLRAPSFISVSVAVSVGRPLCPPPSLSRSPRSFSFTALHTDLPPSCTTSLHYHRYCRC
jgi:hypothetical protein